MRSPPLARGTGKEIKSNGSKERITPACAGNSIVRREYDLGEQDHPRLRGEQPAAEKLFRWLRGSPPLARGTADATSEYYAVMGITPACAGNRIKKDLIYYQT